MNELIESSLHFILSAASGSLAFSLTWIICWRVFGRRVGASLWPVSTHTESRATFLVALSSGLFFAVASHIWLDGLLHIGGISMFTVLIFLSWIDVYIQQAVQVAAAIAAVSGGLWVVLSIRDWRRG